MNHRTQPRSRTLATLALILAACVSSHAQDILSGPGEGPTVTFSVDTVGTTTKVTAAASEALDRLFLRAGVTQN